jgi:hypothetical protein
MEHIFNSGQQQCRGPVPICRHEKRTEIDRALVDGEAFRNIAKRFDSSWQAIRRHKGHLSGKIIKAHEAREVTRADNLLISVVTLRERLEKALEGAAHARDVASLARELRETLRLLLELEGRLRQGATVNVGIGILNSPEWGQIAAAMTEALRDEPSARARVAEALARLANRSAAVAVSNGRV